MEAPLSRYDIFSPAVLDSPYEFFRRLRKEAPVYRVERESSSRAIYLVTTYKLVQEALRHPEIYSSDVNALLGEGAGNNPERDGILAEGYRDFGLMATRDDPAHRHFRALVNTVFTPVTVSKLGPVIDRIVDTLIDDFIERGECDFVREFSAHLPTYLICDFMGIDRSLYERVAEGSDATLMAVGQMGTKEEEIAAARVTVSFQRFLMDLVRERRAKPGDDLISRIVQARVEGEAPLSDVEARAIVQEILIAGNETTRNSLTSGMARLLQAPEQLQKLRDDPGLVGALVEEILRLDTPSSSIFRIAARDTVLGGVEIPAGAVINLRWDSANRDEEAFPNADEIDLARANGRSHVSFGGGIHICLGNVLARRELSVAFTKLIARLNDPYIVMEKSDLSHKPSLLLRMKRGLTIGFTPGPRFLK